MNGLLYIDAAAVEAGLREAVERGLIEPGLAQRVRLVTRLVTAPVAGGAAAPDGPYDAVSGEALGQSLGLSRAAVHKHVAQLRGLGFQLESAAGVGHRLLEPFSDLVAAEALLPHLLSAEGRGSAHEGWRAGLPCHYRASCDSTNRVLRGLIQGDVPPAGTTVVTDHQSQGRGRLDRVWRDQGGTDLMFSVLLRPALAPGQAHLLSLAAALAVAETLESLPDLGLPALETPVDVKWPNDVLVGGRKVCGILLEGAMDGDRLHWAIAGIGLNVNGDTAELAATIEREDPEGLGGRPRPVALRELLGGPVPRAPLLAAFLGRLTARWKDLERPGGLTSVLEGLRRRDPLLGRPVEVFGAASRSEAAQVGEGAGIGPEGQLLVRTPGGDTVPVYAGDVSLRRP
ncbi:MAG: biotin--[acetyl-CoA-carboxylase] ligase [Lentisphaerae bacterium]|nr:biotin--[acetyl-CoA-carboxylase] ligase [Lentisphaerota bacterium]